MREVLFAVLFLFINLFSLFNVILLVEVPFGIRMSAGIRKLAVAGVCFMVTDILLGHILHISEEWGLLAEYLFMVAVVVLFATEKKIRAAVLTVPAVLVYYHWTTLFELLEILFGLDAFYFIEQGVRIRPFMLLDSVALFVLLLLLKKYANKKSMRVSLTVGEGILLVIAGIFSQVGVEFLKAIDEMFRSNLFNVGWIVFLLILNGTLVYSIVHRKKETYYRMLSESYKTQFDKEYTYFKEYKNSNVEMARFRHDWGNHMIVMQELMAQGKYEEAKKYFDSFPTAMIKRRKSGLSGNETVDIILAAKTDLMEENKIELHIEGSLRKLEQMEAVDICILFANLIDNAIEACVQVSGERYLRMKVTESPNMLMVLLENSMSGNLIQEEGRLVTTKKDKTMHGIGMQNVNNIIEKYKGECKTDSAEGKFSVRILLPL